MRVKALIFDCDGVLADTARFGHLPAFNQMFAEFGLPVFWTEEEYGRKVLIGGGKERIASILTPAFVRDAGLPPDASELNSLVQSWHRRKTEIYTSLIDSGIIEPRPGIARVARAAAEHGIALAIASTSAETSVRAVLRRAVGEDDSHRFQIFAGDAVAAKKPAPDIYKLALAALAVPAEEAIAIEDSRNGMLSAQAAGLRTVITQSSYTQGEDFSGAALVVSSLGDPYGEPAVVKAAEAGVMPGDIVTLDDLIAVAAAPAWPEDSSPDRRGGTHAQST